MDWFNSKRSAVKYHNGDKNTESWIINSSNSDNGIPYNEQLFWKSD